MAGLGGIGKTELAVQAVHAAVGRGWFGGGVLAIDLHGASLAPDTAERTGDRCAFPAALSVLGNALWQVRQFGEAITAYTDAIALYRGLGDRHSEGPVLSNLGIALAELRQIEEAITAYQQSLAICRELGDRHGEGNSLLSLGLALATVGRFQDAIVAAQAAMKIFAEVGDPHSEATARQVLEQLHRSVNGQ
ncbi:tetratricopeptide repeat protein [Actinomadura litoris]|uniref:tetratricopeptide repeat protein n=1 Tax=Actinomadura litoris TaxID=2678616 RepID=UPI001FA7D714|nr:tetratricopeptide repeat protein [Actinomadura litoris]